MDCSPKTVTEFICCLHPTLSDFTQYYTKGATGPNNHPDGLLHLGKQLFSSWKKRDRVLCNKNTYPKNRFSSIWCHLREVFLQDWGTSFVNRLAGWCGQDTADWLYLLLKLKKKKSGGHLTGVAHGELHKIIWTEKSERTRLELMSWHKKTNHCDFIANRLRTTWNLIYCYSDISFVCC